MTEITLLFPHQLFLHHPAIAVGRPVWMIEDELFFRQYQFHKQKLILHRASMMFFKNQLQQKGFDITYINAYENKSLYQVFQQLKSAGIETIHYADTTDYLLERRLKRFATQNKLKLICSPSPNFICTSDYIKEYFDSRKKYFLTEFYIAQRKRLHILLQDGKPAGDQWTYDLENRKKMPASATPPALPLFGINDYVEEAIAYVSQHFYSNYGEVKKINYPITHEDARLGLNVFLKERFINYGIYQDALIKENSFLFHSILTPALNIGLLQPAEILDYAISYAHENNIPLNSLEGFVRQVLGWREFVRAVYEREGVKQRTRNHWQHSRKIPASFWNGTTGIEPVDNVIHKVIETGYSNHIERLMVMGNFMLLCEFDPDEVYQWFMEMYIDAYDWVMVPNVYGMSQFADGGLMSTKPYISGSNYILKMSNYKKGSWCEVWDALYWCFIDKHKSSFSRNPRMSMMVKQLEKMDAARLQKFIVIREDFLSAL